MSEEWVGLHFILHWCSVQCSSTLSERSSCSQWKKLLINLINCWHAQLSDSVSFVCACWGTLGGGANQSGLLGSVWSLSAEVWVPLFGECLWAGACVKLTAKQRNLLLFKGLVLLNRIRLVKLCFLNFIRFGTTSCCLPPHIDAVFYCSFITNASVLCTSALPPSFL